MEEIVCEVRLRLLAGHIYAASKLGMWGFDENFQLAYSTSIHQEEFLQLLEVSGGLDYLRGIDGGCRKPVMLGDSLGMVWIAEHFYDSDGKPACLIMFGPLFLSNTSPKNVEKALSAMNFPLQPRLKLMRIVEMVPVMSFSMARQYALMLHHCITEEFDSDFVAYEGDIILFQSERIKEMTAPDMTDDEKSQSALLERSMSVERQLLNCVQHGSRDFPRFLQNANDAVSLLKSDTGNSLRDGKNTMIIFASKCCNAAIEGGVSIYAAKQLEAEYIKKAENSTNMAGLIKLNRQMLEDFTDQVRRTQEHLFLSPVIRESCDFIRANITKEFTLADVAGRAGYTEYYFTRKFYKETGSKVQDYIKEAKIEYAKIQLLTTSKGIQEISDSLYFSNRNYFSKVFREVVGVTPAAFRNQKEN
ncbi:MAG: AraC family transcriptional regulator [Lachnospiraceae bacterium]|nr:AraC family transcriptional regulator [Lachnospiraceae bacterium]